MHEFDVLAYAFVFFFQLFEDEVRVGAAETVEDLADGFHRRARAETGNEPYEQADAFGGAIGDDGSVEPPEAGFRGFRGSGLGGVEDSFGSVHAFGFRKNKNRLSVRRGGWGVRSD